MLELAAEGPENNEGGWRAIGYCGTMVVADTADVQTIGVLPEYEGHGFGRAIAGRCTSVPASRVPSASCWSARADNPRAQRLYETQRLPLRFTVRRGYCDDGTDAIIMECTF